MAKTPATEQQSSPSGQEAGGFYQVGEVEEMKPCHRLDVPKKMLNSIQNSPRPADNSDVRAFDRQGPPILIPAQVCLEEQDQKQDKLNNDPRKLTDIRSVLANNNYFTLVLIINLRLDTHTPHCAPPGLQVKEGQHQFHTPRGSFHESQRVHESTSPQTCDPPQGSLSTSLASPTTSTRLAPTNLLLCLLQGFVHSPLDLRLSTRLSMRLARSKALHEAGSEVLHKAPRHAPRLSPRLAGSKSLHSAPFSLRLSKRLACSKALYEADAMAPNEAHLLCGSLRDSPAPRSLQGLLASRLFTEPSCSEVLYEACMLRGSL